MIEFETGYYVAIYETENRYQVISGTIGETEREAWSLFISSRKRIDHINKLSIEELKQDGYKVVPISIEIIGGKGI